MKEKEVQNQAYEDFKESLENACFHIKNNIPKLKSKDISPDAVNTLFRVFHNLKAHVRYLHLHEVLRVCEACEDILGLLKISCSPVDSDTIRWFENISNQFEEWTQNKNHEIFLFFVTNDFIFNRKPSIKTVEAIIPSEILKTLKVLYVEDESEIRESLSLYIKRRVAKLKIAKNGEEGLKIFKEFLPDLIITDINMPKMHGFEMMEKIRAFDENIPVIFTTAHNEKPFIEKSKKIYSNSYLVKPFEYNDLDKELHKLARMYF